VVISSSRLIETPPGELSQQTSLRRGNAMFTHAGLRTITNAGEEPLEAIEYELL
jgi:hypothetical protein